MLTVSACRHEFENSQNDSSRPARHLSIFGPHPPNIVGNCIPSSSIPSQNSNISPMYSADAVDGKIDAISVSVKTVFMQQFPPSHKSLLGGWLLVTALASKLQVGYNLLIIRL